jgi:hypothetical protein
VAEFTKFEEYQHLVADTARITDRRLTTSLIYVRFNSLLVAAIGLLMKDLDVRGTWTWLLPLPLVAAGTAISLWWRQLIQRYKALVGLRIHALRDMEELPEMAGAVKIYHIEDQLYPRDADGRMIPGEGLNFSDLEERLPWFFMVLYGILGVGALIAATS